MADRPPVPEPLLELFEILGELGRGATGTVYRARDRSSGREFALKVLTGRINAVTQTRLKREGELTAGLRHPGIVGIHSSGQIAGTPYLAYELVPGAQTLNAYWQDKSQRERIRLIHDAAQALGHAHSKGVLHRDVKCENVLVDSTGRVRVADFGLATACDLERLTQSGTILGTPLYASPEQLTGDRRSLGPPTDVWALGVILYEALTGEVPFEGEGLMDLIAKVTRLDPVSPRQLDESVPTALDRVCLRALRKPPSERYPDAKAMAQDLERFLTGGDVLASLPSPRLADYAKRLWWLFPLAVSAGVLALAVAMPLARQAQDSTVGDAPTNERQEPASPPPTNDPPPALLTQSPALVEVNAAAASGDRDAMHALGRLFEHGSRLHAVDPNRRSALAWYAKAADSSNSLAAIDHALLGWSLRKDGEALVEALTQIANRAPAFASRAHGEIARHHTRSKNLDAAAKSVAAARTAKGWFESAWSEFAAARWPTRRDTADAIQEASATDPLRGMLLRRLGDVLRAEGAGQQAAADEAYQQGLAWGDLTCAGRLLEPTSVERNSEEASAALVGTLRETVSGGSLEGQFILGLLCLEGAAPHRSPAKGIEHLKAAAPTYAPAGYHLALVYRDGRAGVSPDCERAATLLRRAAALGHLKAQQALARLLVGRRAAELFPGEAEVRLTIAAAQGDAVAARFLTVGDNTGDSAARVMLEQAHAEADGGSTQAMRRIARAYESGSGAPLDPLRALHWYHRAIAETAHAGAMRRFGELLRQGLLDGAGFVHWLERAAGLGGEDSFRAMLGLAKHYWSNGNVEKCSQWAKPGSERNPKSALIWGYVLRARGRSAEATPFFERAANAGFLDGVAAYAEALGRGDGVPVDLERARLLLERALEQANGTDERVTVELALAKTLSWAGSHADAYTRLLNAAELGSPEAQFRLANALLNGRGVAAAPKHAAARYLRAAQGGVSGAWLELGKLHDAGEGVAANPLLALECYLKAVSTTPARARFQYAKLLHSGRAGKARIDSGLRRLRELSKRGNKLAARYLKRLDR